jgi:hypothetical protein
MKIAFTIFVLFCVIGGCATWSSVDGRLNAQNYIVNIPHGWMKLDSGANVMISRDGPYLQYVLLQERPLDQPFNHTRKHLSVYMLPQEAAQVIIDDLSSDTAVKNLSVLETAPAIIDGHDGFRLLYSYRNAQGLHLKTAYYGFIYEQIYYSLRFTAPQRHYFEKDIRTFESILSNFHLIAAR